MGHSSVYRCDRCGATSAPSPGSGLPPDWVEISTCSAETEDGADTFAADICPTCAASLQAWLRDSN